MRLVATLAARFVVLAWFAAVYPFAAGCSRLLGITDITAADGSVQDARGDAPTQDAATSDSPPDASSDDATVSDAGDWPEVPPSNGQLVLSPSRTDLYTRYLGVPIAPWRYQVRKLSGPATALVTEIIGRDAVEFVIIPFNCQHFASFPAEPDTQCFFDVQLRPTVSGYKEALVRVFSPTAGESFSLIRAKVVPGDLVYAVRNPFGSVKVGGEQVETVEVKNSRGTTTKVIIKMTVTPLDGAIPEFWLQANGCVRALAPAEQCSFIVKFRPTTAGNKRARLWLHTADDDESETILLGTGVP